MLSATEAAGCSFHKGRARAMLEAGTEPGLVAEYFGISVGGLRSQMKRSHRPANAVAVPVPKWVPAELRREYRRITAEFDEFTAAQWAREEAGRPHLPIDVIPQKERQKGRVIYSAPIGPWPVRARPLSLAEEREIVQSIVRQSGFEMAEIVGRRQTHDLVAVRAQIAHALAKRGRSSPYIGRLLYRDHSSILLLMKRRDANGEIIR